MSSKSHQNFSKVVKSLEKIKISQNFSKVLKNSQIYLKIISKMQPNSVFVTMACASNCMLHPVGETCNVQNHFARKNQKFSKFLKKGFGMSMVSFVTVVLHARVRALACNGCVQTNIVEVVAMNECLKCICGSEKNTIELKQQIKQQLKKCI